MCGSSAAAGTNTSSAWSTALRVRTSVVRSGRVSDIGMRAGGKRRAASTSADAAQSPNLAESFAGGSENPAKPRRYQPGMRLTPKTVLPEFKPPST